ncbi:heat-inducible transcriptional repressor HrcA [Phycicoccus sp. SLBN-51]|jgi:heat-inducible transcriptional repressor|uniref:heat-inducible transcriptional repressor HrcA n=1 Tax=Phycicoccus sp. SLBN-51 TaxID=2768447 RepID=UPI00114DF990|nr:heat-inducible transcriptional repressor HrcA [Phycicoccus sp. SLBN-51]TQJ51313.1 heat-inducible transcription repressor HrcA [Phycicoccus sp. SLBN-51]
MSEERRLAVLRAIVQDYVQTSEPVGSKALLERHQLGVSAATVRNDMAVLEEEGLIAAPHTSAGRIPTDAGYRLFVDRLSAVKPLSTAERAAISQFLEGAVDLDDVVDRTVRLLASLTRQVAVMQYPSLTRSSVRHVELVPIGSSRLMVVLIVNTGRVEQRVLESAHDLLTAEGEDLLSRVRGGVNAEAVGKRLVDAAAALEALPEKFVPAERDLVRAVARSLEDALVEEREERVVLAGTSNLARFGTDFPLTIGPVLEALEQHVVLLKLLGEAHVGPDAVAVRIGHENPYAGLQSTSVVSTEYGTGADLVAGIGVVGPTRMDYPTAMASVRAVAAYVSRILSQ